MGHPSVRRPRHAPRAGPGPGNDGAVGLQAKLPRLDRLPPSVLLLAAIVSIQLGSALAITLFPVLGTRGTVFLRLAIGGATIVALYRGGAVAALRRAPLGIAALGAVMAGQTTLYYEALARIPLGITASIEFLGPLGLALATSRRPADVLCVLLAGAGIVLLTPAIGTSLDPVGVACAFGSGILWAAFILVGRRLGRALEGGVGLGLAMTVAALLLLPFAGVRAVEDLALHPGALMSVAGVALFSATIPLLFEFLALKTMAPRTYGVLVSLEPVVATLIGVGLLAQSIGLSDGLAIVLISLAALGAALLGQGGR